MDKFILLVEDNPDDVLLTKRAFKKNNIMNELLVVTSGIEALDFLLYRGQHKDRPRENPVIILLDIQLPGINGIEVLEQIRENPSTELIPVIMLTSSKEDQDLIQSYKNGANSYIRKPVDFTQFVSTVSQLGMYWLVLNEPPPIA